MKITKFFTNTWTLLALSIISLLILVKTCSLYQKPKKHSDWRYEIHGYVMHQGRPHEAIWYTDTIEIGENYATYFNSDGSQVVIPAPYVLIDYKYDTIIEDTTSAF